MLPQDRMVEVIKTVYRLDAPEALDAMRKVPREQFVSLLNRRFAYEDRAVSIGCGQTVSQPYTVAFMTDLLDLKGNEKVLEIGTGSGYQAAVLSLLADQVYTIEIVKRLAISAQRRLKKFGYVNVFVKAGTGECGWSEFSPFDRIIVTAGIENKVPEELFNQLKVGGILIAPIGKGEDKVMTKFIKGKSGKYKTEKHGIFHFVPFVKL